MNGCRPRPHGELKMFPKLLTPASPRLQRPKSTSALNIILQVSAHASYLDHRRSVYYMEPPQPHTTGFPAELASLGATSLNQSSPPHTITGPPHLTDCSLATSH